LLHLGVLILGIAAWISYTKDIFLSADAAPGDTLQLQESEYGVRLDSFVIENTDKGRVKSYSSYVTVLRKDDSIYSSIIRVNHPLKVDGWFLYQNSYGMLPDNFESAVVSIKAPGYSIDTHIVLENNRPVKISKSGHIFNIDHFFCDFMIDRSTNKITNRSMEHDNPAFSYQIIDSLGSEVNAGWSFPLYPDFHGMGQSDFAVTVENYQPVAFSSFQIRRHTGDTVIILAMILISIGLIVVFYFPRKKQSGE
jgi:cytochrome c biogenesis protein ResB